MHAEKGKIAQYQLLFIIVGFVQGSIFLTTFISNLVKNNAWLAILTGLLLISPLVWGYGWLAQRFAGYNFAQINQLLYGRYLGSIVSLLYFYYFLTTFYANLRDVGNFYTTYFMPNTPLEVFLICFTLACGYVVWNGIEALARLCPLLVVTVSAILLLIFLLLLPQMNWRNLFPIGEAPLSKYLHATQIIATFPFGEVVIVLTALPFALNESSRTAKTALSGLLLAAGFFLLIAIRDTTVLGPTEGILLSPAYEAVRLINIGLLTRMDIFFALGHTMAQFIKCSALYYATAIFLAQILQLGDYHSLIFPLGCIAIVLGITSFPSIIDLILPAQGSASLILDLFCFFFPLLAIVLAKWRRLPEKGEPS